MTSTSAAALDPRATYRVGAQVVLRRESFGALAYDLDTQRLLVLRDLDLIAVLERLDASLTIAQAVAEVAPDKERTLIPALARLEREGLIRVV